MKRFQSGQALVIILLVMAVGLTIGLSIISRSITDIRISQQEEESARAFSVAEAGIEEALGTNLAADETLTERVGGIEYNVSATAQGGGDEFVFPKEIEEGDTQTLWLAEHDLDGDLIESRHYYAASLDVCWEETVPETALEVSIIYKDAGGYKVARGAYDAKAVSRGNDFDPNLDSGDCAGLDRRKILNWNSFGINPASDTLLCLRLRPLYNKTQIGVVGTGGSGGNLPSQGKCFVSTATVEESGITRKVQQCQFHKTPLGIFDYVLFSESDLEKPAL